jgi:hypothetical protein
VEPGIERWGSVTRSTVLSMEVIARVMGSTVFWRGIEESIESYHALSGFSRVRRSFLAHAVDQRRAGEFGLKGYGVSGGFAVAG